MDELAPTATKSFWVSYAGKRRISRRHRTGGCYLVPGVDALCYEYFGTEEEATWDFRCKLCWSVGKKHPCLVPAAYDDTASVNTSEESSSTDDPAAVESACDEGFHLEDGSDAVEMSDALG